jgi:hypothetical protein
MQDWRMVRELPARQGVRSTTEAEVNFTDAIFEEMLGQLAHAQYQHHRPWVGGCLGGHTERGGSTQNAIMHAMHWIATPHCPPPTREPLQGEGGGGSEWMGRWALP